MDLAKIDNRTDNGITDLANVADLRDLLELC
jgi:hypothetical protein